MALSGALSGPEWRLLRERDGGMLHCGFCCGQGDGNEHTWGFVCGSGDDVDGRGSCGGSASCTSGKCPAQRSGTARPDAGGESGERAEKYSFKPSPEMNSFGHLAMHIAQTNNTFCAKISGQTAPDVKMSETDPKEKLVAAMKDSFAFCTTALANVDDSKLGEQFVLFGNRPISRGGALVALGGSWTDHYATEAIYLRLNGILPPTAQPEKK